MRWQLPVAYQPEESLYDVSGTSDIKCKQFSWDGEGIVGTEDCLFLNVYVPGQREGGALRSPDIRDSPTKDSPISEIITN